VVFDNGCITNKNVAYVKPVDIRVKQHLQIYTYIYVCIMQWKRFVVHLPLCRVVLCWSKILNGIYMHTNKRVIQVQCAAIKDPLKQMSFSVYLNIFYKILTHYSRQNLPLLLQILSSQLLLFRSSISLNTKDDFYRGQHSSMLCRCPVLAISKVSVSVCVCVSVRHTLRFYRNDGS